MNRIILNRKIISNGIKKGIRYSNDRPPSMDKIRKIDKIAVIDSGIFKSDFTLAAIIPNIKKSIPGVKILD